MAFTSEPPTLPASAVVWRLVKTRHASSAFDGEGAREHGGRWNSPGPRVVYTGSSLALCILEMLVHVDPAAPTPDFLAFKVSLPRAALSNRQTAFPAPLAQTRRIGDDWLHSKAALALAVPSAVVPLESIVLLNPDHPDFSRLKISSPIPYRLDPQLLAGG